MSGYFLAEATANVSRLIDSMLPTDECAETFVRRGGVALLIRLHAMPFLPDTFSTSSACHALSLTLRSFAGRSPYSPILASQTQDALTQCARRASAAVEDAIRLAVRSPAGPVVVFDLVPRLESTAVILDLDGTSMGRLPVPDFLSNPMLPESLSVDGGSDRASPGFLNLPRDFELGDGRRIRIEDLEVVAGEMGIRFRTLP